jgi:hypothetical protein
MFSPGGSSPYTSTHNTSQTQLMYIIRVYFIVAMCFDLIRPFVVHLFKSHKPIVIITMSYAVLGLFFIPEGEAGPSIFFSVVLCFSFPLTYVSVPVWVSCLCLFSLRVVATLVGIVLFPKQCSALQVSPCWIDFFPCLT